MRKLYVVNPDGTVMFLEPINVECPEKIRESAKVSIHRFWEARSGEGKSYRGAGTPVR